MSTIEKLRFERNFRITLCVIFFASDEPIDLSCYIKSIRGILHSIKCNITNQRMHAVDSYKRYLRHCMLSSKANSWSVSRDVIIWQRLESLAKLSSLQDIAGLRKTNLASCKKLNVVSVVQ